MDGSTKGNLLDAGEVIRSDNGKWLIGFLKFISFGMELAKAWYLFLGLETANFLKIHKLKIETDSQKIFRHIKENTNEFHPLATLISNCKHILSSFEDHKLFKISRKKNLCVDLLAKNARKSQSPLRTFSEAPPKKYIVK